MTAFLQKAPHQWTAVETVAALKARKIGALELLEHGLDRRARLDGDVNSVVEVRAEAARQAAKAADASDASSPLAGLPMTIKETYEIEGFHTTAGIPELKDYVSTDDAPAVARLRAAGAVIWGKTNVPVAASDHQSYNPLHGVCRNPWDTSRTVGGSSGGAATLAVRSAFPRISAGSGGTSPPTTSFRRAARCRPRARWRHLRFRSAVRWGGPLLTLSWGLICLQAVSATMAGS